MARLDNLELKMALRIVDFEKHSEVFCMSLDCENLNQNTGSCNLKLINIVDGKCNGYVKR